MIIDDGDDDDEDDDDDDEISGEWFAVWVLSGNDHSYWTWQFSSLIYLLKVVICHSYLSVPEGILINIHTINAVIPIAVLILALIPRATVTDQNEDYGLLQLYIGWWFGTCFIFHIWGHPNPIDEVHHFSRWAHCTTNQTQRTSRLMNYGDWATRSEGSNRTAARCPYPLVILHSHGKWPHL